MRRQRWYCKDLGTEYDGGPDDQRKPVAHDSEANLISSLVHGQVDSRHIPYDSDHMPVLDVDHRIEFIPLEDGKYFATHIFPQHFNPNRIDALADLLLRLDLSDMVASDGRTNRVSVYWSVPVKVSPSWTPGHHHMFINKVLKWKQYAELLDALADAHIIEDGYLMAALERGATFVSTKPWKESHVKQG